MKINKSKLFELYMNKVSEISETCDWKSEFGPEEIVNLIAEILENNPYLVVFPDVTEPWKETERDDEVKGLKSCEQCGENAWDGYIFHSCGLKEI